MPRPAENWVEKIALSKLTFTTPWGGRCLHRTARAVLGIFKWVGRIWWNSCTKCRAYSGIFLRIRFSTSRDAPFLLFQSKEMILANTSTQLGSCWAKWTISMKAKRDDVAFLSLANWGSHTVSSFGQDHRAWVVVSSSRLQLGHVLSCNILHRTRFTLVGKESLHALQRRVRMRFGTWRFQIFFQTSFHIAGLETLGASISSNSKIKLYPDFTEYTPLRFFGQ